MIESQLFLWISLSFVGGFFAFLLLTEGKNAVLFAVCSLFNVSIGILTGYVWLLMTNGLRAFDWMLVFLPLLISSIGTMLVLSYYRLHYSTSAFPKKPRLAMSKTASMASIVLVASLSLVTAMMLLPSTAPQPAITTLGSTGAAEISSDSIVGATGCLECLESPDIAIQCSVVSPTTLRNNPKQGENLNFKVEFASSEAYINPSITVFVQDRNGKLIPTTNLVAYNTASNSVEGQIYCDKTGVFNITAVVYDLAMSQTEPVAVNTLSYTVFADTGAGAVAGPADFFAFCMVIMFIAVLLLVWVVVAYKKYS